MKRPKIKWSEEEIDILIDYYLSFDCITNQERIHKTWNDLYNNNNKLGYFRSEKNVNSHISRFLKQKNIDTPHAYKNPPKGFHLIPNMKWHCINENMKVLNMKTGKFLEEYLNTQGYKCIRIRECGVSKNKSLSRIYVELFLDPSKPYQVQENGIPIQTEKGKIRGISNSKKKTYEQWLNK